MSVSLLFILGAVLAGLSFTHGEINTLDRSVRLSWPPEVDFLLLILGFAAAYLASPFGGAVMPIIAAIVGMILVYAGALAASSVLILTFRGLRLKAPKEEEVLSREFYASMN